MIEGTVVEGIPTIHLTVGDKEWRATIDTGFSGELELPDGLAESVNRQYFGHGISLLAGGQSVEEDHYLVDFPFDGVTVRALATFVPGDEILVGTGLLAEYELNVGFPRSLVVLQRSGESKS